jgi:hypothetical protein
MEQKISQYIEIIRNYEKEKNKDFSFDKVIKAYFYDYGKVVKLCLGTPLIKIFKFNKNYIKEDREC